MASKFQGDVAEHLLAAIQQTQLSHECEAAALFTAAVWCEKQRGGKLPEELIPTARKLARHVKRGTQEDALLLALALRTKDEGLLALFKQLIPSASPEKWPGVEKAAREIGDAFAVGAEKPVLQLVADKPSNSLASGTTLRRAVARIGRNEPCPCGSGRKYKRCCLEKDQERLHHSSTVTGLTQEELEAQPEPHLTQAMLDKTNPYEIAKFDPVKIPAALRGAYFLRLSAFNLFDEAATAFEKIGYTDELKGIWDKVVFLATRAGRAASLRRLVNVLPNPAEAEENLFTGAALLLAGDEPAKLLKILDECALDALQKNEPDNLRGFAYSLMFSKLRALGVLVGRGTLPILPPAMAAGVFERILEARDRLNLPPDDPFSDIMDKRLAEQDASEDNKDSAKLRQAQRSLAVKMQEVRELKDTLERLQKEIVRREKKSATPTPTVLAPKPAPADEAALKEMRRKVDELKSALKERHHERNELRRELQKTQASLEEIHKNGPPVYQQTP
jgi:hypothetical protein